MKKRILVAPLNWGIGHATRCIPIINALIKNNFEPIIASDGGALQLLKKEFPDVTSIELDSYKIEYSKKGKDLKWKLITQVPKVLKTINSSKKVPSVLITHQLNVLSGNTSAFSSMVNQFSIKKFDEIWIPDFEKEPSLSGKLGHMPSLNTLNLKYIGALSRFKKLDLNITYDLMVLLSGPEPQRTILEEKLLEELQNFKGEILFIKGKIEEEQTFIKKDNFTIYNFMFGKTLEEAMNASKLILSRSGYTTVMDLAKLEKKAFFIPTPGQFEQEYLAKRLDELNLVPSCNQDDFSVELLTKVKSYNGLKIKERGMFSCSMPSPLSVIRTITLFLIKFSMLTSVVPFERPYLIEFTIRLVKICCMRSLSAFTRISSS